MDMYFTSVSLTEWSIDQKFTIVGTMQHDHKGIPKEMKSMKHREINHFCSTQWEEYHNALVHRQEKIGNKEHHLLHHHAWPLLISYHVTTLHGWNQNAGLWWHLLSCWTPSEQTAKQFSKTTRRPSTTLNWHPNWEKPWCCQKSGRGLRIQITWKLQFFRM